MIEPLSKNLSELEMRLRQRPWRPASATLRQQILRSVSRALDRERAARPVEGWRFAAGLAATFLLCLNLSVMDKANGVTIHFHGAEPLLTPDLAVELRELNLDLPPAELRRMAVVLSEADRMRLIPVLQTGRAYDSHYFEGTDQ